MAGATKTRSQAEAERFRNEWEAKFIGILNPWLMPLVEKALQETPPEPTEAERFRDKWEAQIAHIMMPWFFPAP